VTRTVVARAEPPSGVVYKRTRTCASPITPRNVASISEYTSAIGCDPPKPEPDSAH
jgi:hypothetical protein